MYKLLKWRLPHEVIAPEEYDRSISTHDKTPEELGFIPPPGISFVSDRILYSGACTYKDGTKMANFGPRITKLCKWAFQTYTPRIFVTSYVYDLLKSYALTPIDEYDITALTFLIADQELSSALNSALAFMKKYEQYYVYLQTGKRICIKYKPTLSNPAILLSHHEIPQNNNAMVLRMKIYDYIAYVANTGNWVQHRFKNIIDNERFYDLFMYYAFDTNLQIAIMVR